MYHEEEAYFRGGSYPDRYDDFYDDMDDVYSDAGRHHGEGDHCRRCGCHIHHRYKNCNGRCHSHHHGRKNCRCHSHHHGKRKCNCERSWCDCGCYHSGVCRELAWILKEQRNPRKDNCGCASSINQLRRSNQKNIIPFALVTRYGQLYVEWGRQHHHHRSYATVFFSVTKVNCRRNEAILELLRPNQPITNPRTGKVEKWRIQEVDYVVPTGERVYVDLEAIREVRRFPKNFVRRRR